MSMGPLSLITRLTKISQFIKAKMAITPRDFLYGERKNTDCQVHHGTVVRGSANSELRE